jgi:NAD kinase
VKIKYVPSPDKRERFQKYSEFVEAEFPELLSCREPDLVMTAGGDGTMLSVIQEWREMDVPFLGRGLGSLNFLMNEFVDGEANFDVNLTDVFEKDQSVIRAILEDEIKIDTQKTSLVKVHCCDVKGEESVLGEAVNDVVIGTDVMGYHHFSLGPDLASEEDATFKNFKVKGTGVCVSTPIGSTGYNFNNGGKVLPLNSDSWSVTGVVCNRRLNHVIEEQKLEIGVLNDQIKSKDYVEVYIDGLTKKIQLGVGSKVFLEPGSEIELAFLDREKFMQKRADIVNGLR